jgi:hypothetical protein
MTKRNFSFSAFASLATLVMLSFAACHSQVGSRAEPQTKRRCDGDYKQAHWILIDDRAGAHERMIASMTAFARTHGMDYEANRYPQGVPGNTHPQFLMSICNEHFYALAGNQDPGSVTVHILSDTSGLEAGVDPLAVTLATQLQDEFEDAAISSDLRHSLSRNRNLAGYHPLLSTEKPSAPAH